VKRGTTARGYGWRHQQERKRWAPLVAAGLGVCVRGGHPIPPGMPWDLDHTDDRTGYLGISCRRCNRQAGARRGNAARSTRRVNSEVW
jgi:hypothetical protein